MEKLRGRLEVVWGRSEIAGGTIDQAKKATKKSGIERRNLLGRGQKLPVDKGKGVLRAVDDVSWIG